MTNINIQKESFIKAHGIHHRKNHKPVMCITTGEIYASVLDAAEANGVSYSAMSWVCCGRMKSCKGKRFCFVANVTEHLDEIAECMRIREAKAKAYDEINAKQEAVRKAKEEYDRRQAKVAELKKALAEENALMYKARNELRTLQREMRGDEE